MARKNGFPIAIDLAQLRSIGLRMIPLKPFSKVLLILSCLSGFAGAVSLVSDSILFAEDGNNLSIGVTEPLSFVVNTAGTGTRFSIVMPDVVPLGGGSGGFQVVYSLDSVPILSSDVFTQVPTLSVSDFTGGRITFYFDFSASQSLAVGDEVTLNPGVFAMGNYFHPAIDFPFPNAPESGIFLGDAGRQYLSEPAAIPEPSGWLLLAVGCSVFLLRHRE